MEEIEEDPDVRSWTILIKPVARATTWFMIIALAMWTGYIFTPTKKDALLIVAGGAVGNFITKDTSAKQIPSEVMTLLRDKIRAEIKDIHVEGFKDTLMEKSKEELIEMYKNKK